MKKSRKILSMFGWGTCQLEPSRDVSRNPLFLICLQGYPVLLAFLNCPVSAYTLLSLLDVFSPEKDKT